LLVTRAGSGGILAESYSNGALVIISKLDGLQSEKVRPRQNYAR
jgi:hypothetical protein